MHFCNIYIFLCTSNRNALSFFDRNSLDGAALPFDKTAVHKMRNKAEQNKKNFLVRPFGLLKKSLFWTFYQI